MPRPTPRRRARAQPVGDRALQPRFSGLSWEPAGTPLARQIFGLVVMLGLAAGCGLSMGGAASGRAWLVGGFWAAAGASLWLIVTIIGQAMRGRPPAPTGWHARAPWPAGPMLPEERDSPWQLAGALAFLLALGGGLAAEAILVLLAQPSSALLPLGLFSLLALGGAGVAGYRLAQGLRFTPAHLRPPAGGWPLAAGRNGELDVAGPPLPLPDGGALRARLLLLQERRVTTFSSRRGSRTTTVVDVLALAPVALRHRTDPRDGLDARLSFTLPAGPLLAPDSVAAGNGIGLARHRDGSIEDPSHPRPQTEVPADTDTQAMHPRYWLLAMHAELPGIDWYAEWLVPVAATG